MSLKLVRGDHDAEQFFLGCRCAACHDFYGTVTMCHGDPLVEAFSQLQRVIREEDEKGIPSAVIVSRSRHKTKGSPHTGKKEVKKVSDARERLAALGVSMPTGTPKETLEALLVRHEARDAAVRQELAEAAGVSTVLSSGPDGVSLQCRGSGLQMVIDIPPFYPSECVVVRVLGDARIDAFLASRFSHMRGGGHLCITRTVDFVNSLSAGCPEEHFAPAFGVAFPLCVQPLPNHRVLSIAKEVRSQASHPSPPPVTMTRTKTQPKKRFASPAISGQALFDILHSLHKEAHGVSSDYLRLVAREADKMSHPNNAAALIFLSLGHVRSDYHDVVCAALLPVVTATSTITWATRGILLDVMRGCWGATEPRSLRDEVRAAIPKWYPLVEMHDVDPSVPSTRDVPPPPYEYPPQTSLSVLHESQPGVVAALLVLCLATETPWCIWETAMGLYPPGCAVCGLLSNVETTLGFCGHVRQLCWVHMRERYCSELCGMFAYVVPGCDVIPMCERWNFIYDDCCDGTTYPPSREVEQKLFSHYRYSQENRLEDGEIDVTDPVHGAVRRACGGTL